MTGIVEALTALFLIQFPANVPGKAVGRWPEYLGPGPFTLIGDQDGVPNC